MCLQMELFGDKLSSDTDAVKPYTCVINSIADQIPLRTCNQTNGAVFFKCLEALGGVM